MAQSAVVNDPGPRSAPEPIEVKSALIITGSVFNRATLQLILDGKVETFMNGDDRVASGPVEAMCFALHRMFPGLECEDYTVKSKGRSSDAVAFATVMLRIDGDSFFGTGEDQNTMVATAKAIANALDKLRYHAHKNGRGG